LANSVENAHGGRIDKTRLIVDFGLRPLDFGLWNSAPHLGAKTQGLRPKSQDRMNEPGIAKFVVASNAKRLDNQSGP